MCVNPSYIWVERGPKWEKQPAPCRDCWRCRQNRLNDYVGRCLAEASVSDWVVSLTLTYAPRQDLAETMITPRHFQNFVRALRKRGHKIRYLGVGEYGETKGRAHFHCVLFGKGAPPEIPQQQNWHIDAWPHGHVFADWGGDERALRYVAKYLLKGEKGRYWFTISKKPPIGAGWFAQKAQEAIEAGVVPSSFEYRPPGAHRDRPYLLTGASRRDYLRAILDGLGMDRAALRRRMSEWLDKATEKLERWEHSRIPLLADEEFDEAFRAVLANKAPRRDYMRILLDTAPEIWLQLMTEALDAEGWPSVGHEDEAPSREGSGASPRQQASGGDSAPARALSGGKYISRVARAGEHAPRPTPRHRTGDGNGRPRGGNKQPAGDG